MRYEKQVLGALEKCYALSTVQVDGVPCLLAAAEKHDPCYRFDLNGQMLDTVWEGPGGVMTMVPVPGVNGTFLATHEFYSPNDSTQARLVCARKEAAGWRVTTVAELPFVHRFDILPRNGVNYILACTLKSGHEYKNDWRFPGRLWAGVLPDAPASPLELAVLREGLGHNHGYTRYEHDGVVSGIMSCDRGVYRVTPPEAPGGDWQVETLLDVPASDAVLMDLDGDGKPELFTISPFHGDTITIRRMDNSGTFREVYRYPEALPFLHAIWGGVVYGRPTVYAGNREGDRLLLGFYYDAASGEFRCETVDAGAGPANCMLFERNGHPALLAANRETNEIAVYDIWE